MRTPVFVFRARRWLRRHRLTLVVPACLLAMAATGLFVLAGAGPPPEAAETATPSPDAKPREFGAAKVESRMEQAAAAVERPAPGSDMSGWPEFNVPPPMHSVDGTSFRHGEDNVRLWGVEGPKEEDVCLDSDRRRWSCGLQARAALHNIVAGERLQCQPRKALAARKLLASCRLSGGERRPGGDLAALIVEQGWARPDAEGRARYASEADSARQRRAGLWRGGWTISSSAP